MRNGIDDTVVALRPMPGLAAPTHVAFSPCRKFLTYLAPSSASDLLTQHLFFVDLPSAAGPHQVAWDPSSDAAETEESLSLEEKLRRERSRQMGVGVTQYAWSAIASRMLVPLNGNIFIKEASTFSDPAKARLVFDKAAASSAPAGDDATGGAVDPTMSPSGELVAFVRDSELYAMSLEADGAAPVRLTFDARHTGRTNGLADYLAQEEMDRYKGFWWSQTSNLLAFEQVDESHIPEYRIMHQGSDEVGSGAQEDHRYPFAGKANPKVRLGIVDAVGALAEPAKRPPVRWLDTSLPGDGDDIYVARVDWLPDGSLGVQLENREQSLLVFYRYDVETGRRTELVRETSNVWINLNDLCVAFESAAAETAFGGAPFIAAAAEGAEAMDTSGDGQSPRASTVSPLSATGAPGFFFTWGSERSGFMHLYLYYFHRASGKVSLVRQLTKGEWLVTSLVQVSIERGLLFFNGTAEGPLERHVYACKLWDEEHTAAAGAAAGPLPREPGPLVRLTTRKGTNSVVIDHECQLAAWTWTDVAEAPTTVLSKVVFSGAGIQLEPFKTLHAGAESPLVAQQLRGLSYALRPPEFISFQSSDGQVELHGAVYLPDVQKHGNGPYPLIVPVYGGPHVQRVLDTWSTTADMRAQRFADAGYVVLKVDNRGSSGRGIAFEGAIKHRMGTVEVDDQVDGVNALVARGLADPERVGIYGWSYGGYMSLMCLMKRPGTFHVAVSGAPVTHWDGYDTHYTERYMGTPTSNPTGYEEGSVMRHVYQLEGKLMLVHGLIDENVHFRHTARLINSLIAARKTYDLLLFPEERHSPRRLQDRIYMEQRIKAYFDQYLRDRTSKKQRTDE